MKKLNSKIIIGLFAISIAAMTTTIAYTMTESSSLDNDPELRRAIEMSLQGENSNTQTNDETTGTESSSLDNDPELRRAIEMSLQEENSNTQANNETTDVTRAIRDVFIQIFGANTNNNGNRIVVASNNSSNIDNNTGTHLEEIDNGNSHDSNNSYIPNITANIHNTVPSNNNNRITISLNNSYNLRNSGNFSSRIGNGASHNSDNNSQPQTSNNTRNPEQAQQRQESENLSVMTNYTTPVTMRTNLPHSPVNPNNIDPTEFSAHNTQSNNGNDLRFVAYNNTTHELQTSRNEISNNQNLSTECSLCYETRALVGSNILFARCCNNNIMLHQYCVEQLNERTYTTCPQCRAPLTYNTHRIN